MGVQEAVMEEKIPDIVEQTKDALFLAKIWSFVKGKVPQTSIIPQNAQKLLEGIESARKEDKISERNFEEKIAEIVAFSDMLNQRDFKLALKIHAKYDAERLAEAIRSGELPLKDCLRELEGIVNLMENSTFFRIFLPTTAQTLREIVNDIKRDLARASGRTLKNLSETTLSELASYVSTSEIAGSPVMPNIICNFLLATLIIQYRVLPAVSIATTALANYLVLRKREGKLGRIAEKYKNVGGKEEGLISLSLARLGELKILNEEAMEGLDTSLKNPDKKLAKEMNNSRGVLAKFSDSFELFATRTGREIIGLSYQYRNRLARILAPFVEKIRTKGSLKERWEAFLSTFSR